MSQSFDPSSFDVIHSDLVPPDRLYIYARGYEPRVWQDGLTAMDWRPQPVTIKGQATKIVQDGLADVVAWLKAAGHTIPSWGFVDDVEQMGRTDPYWKGWITDEQVSMTLINPGNAFRVTDGFL